MKALVAVALSLAWVVSPQLKVPAPPAVAGAVQTLAGAVSVGPGQQPAAPRPQSQKDGAQPGDHKASDQKQQAKQNQQAAQPAQVVCNLTVPADPLSAQGLATPYLLSTADDGGSGGDGSGACKESDPNFATFVQAAVIDPARGQVAVYDPLVVDRGSHPGAQPAVPTLPAGAVVGVWVGFNGNSLKLDGPGAAGCVQGVEDSTFGQNAFCNADAFFAAANAAIQAHRLAPPDLGTGKDGRTCPSARDFSLVDQDQSDNTTTQYLVTGDGKIAQSTPANRARFPDAKVAFNGSDEGVVDLKLDPALGCTPWMVPDLTDPSHQQKVTAWPLNELQAAAHQAAPVAVIPALDPFTLVNGKPDLAKLNAYRAGVDQAPVASLADADTTPYCRSLLQVGLPRIAADRTLTQAAPSPFPAMASSLFTFLAMRFQNTFSNQTGFLFCGQRLGVQSPIKLRMKDGVVTDASIDLNPPPAKDGDSKDS